MEIDDGFLRVMTMISEYFPICVSTLHHILIAYHISTSTTQKSWLDRYVIIDLGKTRLVSEMGVEFGNAVERLPSAITFKYLGEETSVVTPQSFSTFGKVTSNIEEYVSAVWFGSVQARYVLYQFQVSYRYS